MFLERPWRMFDRDSLRFCLDKEHFDNWVSKPEFKNVVKGIGDENFRILNMKTNQVKLNKPIFCGQAVLDLSKVHMYDFYYNTMKPKYGDNLRLVLTDTDSFVFAIKTDDWYNDMYEMREHFDTSAFPKDHNLFSNDNKKVVGKFKDELCDGDFDVMTEVCAAKSKCYSYITKDITDGEKVKKVLKGVNKVSKRDQITFDDYKSCVIGGKSLIVEQKSIRSFQCQNYTITQKKQALSCYEDKRYQLDGVKTIAYGHYSLE